MDDSKYVVFSLAEELYGLPIERVEQILTDQATIRIPRTPKMLKGIFELRGETIAAVDLRERFEFDPREEPGNMVIASTQVGRVAFRVDGVDGIYDFEECERESNPALAGHPSDQFMSGVGKRDGKLVLLLDPEKLLPQNLEKSVAKASKAA